MEEGLSENVTDIGCQQATTTRSPLGAASKYRAKSIFAESSFHQSGPPFAHFCFQELPPSSSISRILEGNTYCDVNLMGGVQVPFKALESVSRNMRGVRVRRGTCGRYRAGVCEAGRE